MGLQPHQPARTGKSKWRDGPDNDRLQHETGDQYPGHGKATGQAQGLEARL